MRGNQRRNRNGFVMRENSEKEGWVENGGKWMSLVLQTGPKTLNLNISLKLQPITNTFHSILPFIMHLLPTFSIFVYVFFFLILCQKNLSIHVIIGFFKNKFDDPLFFSFLHLWLNLYKKFLLLVMWNLFWMTFWILSIVHENGYRLFWWIDTSGDQAKSKIAFRT